MLFLVCSVILTAAVLVNCGKFKAKKVEEEIGGSMMFAPRRPPPGVEARPTIPTSMVYMENDDANSTWRQREEIFE
ncbi:uncharacterized protein CELE_H12I13.6 [Caenorhabditis elegans]|uniref:Secreted protein n=1 Tax=Caenorhabditis elegans TaxID=6239 RepID=Q8WTN2_CAEEL|nr:Secreted protein [Caenorhabditis elegans]CCD69859.1 Secreted protein [Caenorhabditis elegans]|eukprot:NP_741008.1 Uncharacterized protein CELE_H12I13.6 [Caenorhabditis elegans]